MDVFGDDIFAEIHGNHVKHIQIHRMIRKFQFGNLKYAAVLEVQFWNGKMMDQGRHDSPAEHWQAGRSSYQDRLIEAARMNIGILFELDSNFFVQFSFRKFFKIRAGIRPWKTSPLIM